jgi:hypothetical protein
MSAPTSPWLPTRSVVCPACGTPFQLPVGGRCASCEVDLSHPAVGRLLELEDEHRAMLAERDQLLTVLAGTRPGVSTPVWERAAPPPVATSGEAAPRTPRLPLTVPTLLALAGIALLTAAAVVFTAVVWTTLPSWTQALLLLAATVVAGATAFALSRREIPTAAAALGVVTMSFAAVDVVGLQRTGLVDLDLLVVPAAATIAAVVGWWLARHRLRWVATTGALAAVVAAASLTGTLAGRYELAVIPVALIGLGCSLVLAATIGAWPSRPARLTVSIGAALGVTLVGLLVAVALAVGEASLLAAIGVIALAIVALVAASRWAPVALTPATLLVSVGVAAVAADLGAEGFGLIAVVGVAVVAAAWALPTLAPDRRPPVVRGLAPAALAMAGATLATVDPLVSGWVAAIAGDSRELLDPFAPAVVGLVAATVLAVPAARRHAGWAGVGVGAVLSAAVPVAVAWPALIAFAVGAALVSSGRRSVRDHDVSSTPFGPSGPRERPTALPFDPLVPLVLAVLAVGWAAGTSWTLAVAAAGAAAVGGVTGSSLAGVSTVPDEVRRQVANAIGMVASAIAVWAAADAAEALPEVALGAALVTVFALIATMPALREGPRPIAGTIVAVGATVVLPAVATSLRGAGVLLLIAAVGWLVLSIAGWRHARWLTALAASVGIGVLLGDADVTTVEAYTLAPALTLGAAGTWHLIEDRTVRTAVALTPALAVGLLPSLAVLADDPRTVVRTVGLVVVAGALAAVGARLRWLAPLAAGVVAAVIVALTQLTMVVEVVPRWVSFAVVGVLLVYLAASYERQRQRARAIAGRLEELR